MFWHQTINTCGNYSYNAFIYEDLSLEPHFHGNYELICVLEGSASVSVNGLPQLLYRGEWLLISPYAVHALQLQASKVWVGVFSEDFISSFAGKNRYLHFGKFRCAPTVDSFLREHLLHTGQIPRYLHIACLYMVCSECVTGAPVLGSRQDQKFMHSVIAYITDHLDQNLSLQSVSDTLNYEYHYFSTLFHRCFGMHFSAFVNLFRFEQACGMLSGKELEISDVCSRCGFGSIRNFNRVFKKLSGVTPSQYRRQWV